jgi:hypothetical protein
MMNFLVTFDPLRGQSQIVEYADDEIAQAMEARLQGELHALRERQRLEIVVLNARTIDDLRRTHARYFGDDFLKEEIRRLAGDDTAA